MGQWTPMDSPMPPVPWYSGLDRTVGQAWSVREGCPVGIPWTSIGQVGQSQVDRGF